MEEDNNDNDQNYFIENKNKINNQQNYIQQQHYDDQEDEDQYNDDYDDLEYQQDQQIRSYIQQERLEFQENYESSSRSHNTNQMQSQRSNLNQKQGSNSLMNSNRYKRSDKKESTVNSQEQHKSSKYKNDQINDQINHDVYLQSNDGQQIFQNTNEYQDREQFEFNAFLFSNKQSTGGRGSQEINLQDNQQLDSQRSSYSLDSGSQPDSSRDHQQQVNQDQKYRGQPLNIQDLTYKLQDIKQNQKNAFQDNFSNHSGEHSLSDNFTLMNNSPGRNSLLLSFQGQQTSNFPNNLHTSSLMKLREVSTNSNEINLLVSSPNPIKSEQKMLSLYVQDQFHNQQVSQFDGQLSLGPPQHNQNLNDKQYTSNQKPQISSQQDSERFQDSFYQFEGSKIKDFERSTLIRFEEFEGQSSQQESDPYRKQSERGITDRIYERIEDNKTPTSAQLTQERLTEQDDQELKLTEEQQYYDNFTQVNNDQQYKEGKQLPLFIITEEDHSEIHSSSYQTFNRLQSINSSQVERNHPGGSSSLIGSEFMRISFPEHQQHYNTKDMQLSNKSKSQPIRHQRSQPRGSSKQLQRGNGGSQENNQIVRTDTSPVIKKDNQLSPSFQDNAKYYMNHQRMNTDAPFNYFNITEQDQVSQQFMQRIQKNPGHRPNMNSANISQPDFVMSDEDLLSNIDRVSKILPTNEISEDDIERPGTLSNIEETNLIQKFKEQRQIIDHLKCENQNKQTLILIKESQINLLQHKNEQLEEKILEMEQLLMSYPNSTRFPLNNKVETFTQVSFDDIQVVQSERKKSIKGKKNKQSLSQMKRMPFRQEDNHIYSDSGISVSNRMSKQNSQSNVFDTPQIKLDQILRGESPQSLPKNTIALSKHYSMSFNSDEVNNFKQQIVLIKQQLQRSEENNLNLQQKIEKQKKDKSEYKEKVFQLSIDKNDLQKQVESLAREIDDYEKKCEAMKLDITDYQRQVEIMEMKLKTKKTLVERSLSAKELPLFYDQGIQTDNNSQNYNASAGRKTPIEEDPMHQYLEHQYNNSSNQSSSKSINQPSQATHQLNFNQPNTNNNITIINGKSNLGLLLGKAKDYEHMSNQLQNEINEYRRIQRENFEKAQREQEEQIQYQKKLKKRESKIMKLKSINKILEKDKLELKVKLEEYRRKIQEVRIKMESKLQEKEFKIISIKNQMKHYQQPSFSGMLTPSTPTINNNSALTQNKMFNHLDLYNIINQIVQQQILANPSVIQSELMSKKISQENLLKQRAKSHDQPHHKNNITTVSFYDESPINTGLQEPRIITNPTNVFYGQGEIPSFSMFKQDNVQSPQSQNNSNLNNQNKRSHSVSHREDTGNNTQEIQYIFNSSLKRINHELEQIKDLNSGVSSQIRIGSKMNNQQHSNKKQLRVPQSKILSEIQPKSIKLINNYEKYEEIKKDLSQIQHTLENQYNYDDSLQTHLAENIQQRHETQEQNHSNISNLLLEQFIAAEQKQRQRSLNRLNNDDMRLSYERQYRKSMNLQNAQTFRKTNSIELNIQSPQVVSIPQFSKAKFDFNEQALFNNTQNNLDKEQNVSIFYDFKPAFENSNYTINTQLNQSNNQKTRKIDESSLIINESKQNSMNASLRTPAQLYTHAQHHVKLQSNLMTKELDLDSLSPNSTVKQYDAIEQQHKNLNDHQNYSYNQASVQFQDNYRQHQTQNNTYARLEQQLKSNQLAETYSQSSSQSEILGTNNKHLIVEELRKQMRKSQNKPTQQSLLPHNITSDQNSKQIFTPLIKDYAEEENRLKYLKQNRSGGIYNYKQNTNEIMSLKHNSSSNINNRNYSSIQNRMEEMKQSHTSQKQPMQKTDFKKNLQLQSKLQYDDYETNNQHTKYPGTSLNSNSINLKIDPDIHMRNLEDNHLYIVHSLQPNSLSNQHDGSRSTISNYSQKLDDLRKRYGRLN